MTILMHGMSQRRNWNVDSKEGLANAAAEMREHVKRFIDQGRWVIPRSGSIVVIDQINKEASLVYGPPHPSVQKVFEAMEWKWTDRTTVASNREPIFVTKHHRALPALKRAIEQQP